MKKNSKTAYRYSYMCGELGDEVEPSLICLPICTMGGIGVRITYTDNYVLSRNNQSAPRYHVHKAYICLSALDLSLILRVDRPNIILVNISFMSYCHF